MTNQTYVFESVEVKKTGRTAKREMKLPNGKVHSTALMVEITPTDEDLGWKKWVDEAHLFTVNPESSNENK
jgi:hypothetical protein